MIVLHDVSVEYEQGDRTFSALSHISLVVEKGDFVCVMGKSGSGKTTLLNVISGLQRPTSGTVSVAGTDISRMDDKKASEFRNKTIGYVPQKHGLVPTLTVTENIMLPALLRKGRRSTRADAEDLMERLGIGSLGGSFPSELSGGEQRRVSIARSLINGPEVVLADEPTSDLDDGNSKTVMELLESINRQGTTVVVVTHETDAAAYGKKLYRMENGRLSDISDRLKDLARYGR